MYQKLQQCVQAIRARTDFVPSVALVLGSGLGQYAQEMDLVCEIPYVDIPGFPCSTVAGHDGRYLFGYVAGVPVVAMKGRVHYYEGYDIADVVLPIRTMGLLGAKTLMLTNAAGGIRPGLVDHQHAVARRAQHVFFAHFPHAGGDQDSILLIVYAHHAARHKQIKAVARQGVQIVPLYAVAVIGRLLFLQNRLGARQQTGGDFKSPVLPHAFLAALRVVFRPRHIQIRNAAIHIPDRKLVHAFSVSQGI